MVRSALILIPIALVLMSNKGCQTIEERASNAAVAQGQAQASAPFPDLPEACTAKVKRVTVRDEPWVIFDWRWNVSADNRDRQAGDCAAWGTDMKSRYAGAR